MLSYVYVCACVSTCACVRACAFTTCTTFMMSSLRATPFTFDMCTPATPTPTLLLETAACCCPHPVEGARIHIRADMYIWGSRYSGMDDLTLRGQTHDHASCCLPCHYNCCTPAGERSVKDEKLSAACSSAITTSTTITRSASL